MDEIEYNVQTYRKNVDSYHSNLRKDPVAKFRGGGDTGGIGNCAADTNNQINKMIPSDFQGSEEEKEGELKITFDLPTEAAERLEAFARQCIEDQRMGSDSMKMHRELIEMGIRSLQMQGNEKLCFYKRSTSTTQLITPKNLASGPPSLLINLLNQDSTNKRYIGNHHKDLPLGDDEKKVRLKLKMPLATSTTPRLPSETSLSVVGTQSNSDEASLSPLKVPKLIVSMRNKTIKTSAGTKDSKRRHHEDINSKNIFSPGALTKTVDKIVGDPGVEPGSQKLNQCLNFSMGKELSKANGDNITNIEDNPTISDYSSIPTSSTSSPTSSNTTKMVPVKLVTVTKGEGNVRLVRVSPVKSSSPAPVMSSNNHRADNGVNGNTVAAGVNGNTVTAEVPSPQKTETVEHIASRKRPSRELNSHECVSKKQSV